jgi:hypothetical protein
MLKSETAALDSHVPYLSCGTEGAVNYIHQSVCMNMTYLSSELPQSHIILYTGPQAHSLAVTIPCVSVCLVF